MSRKKKFKNPVVPIKGYIFNVLRKEWDANGSDDAIYNFTCHKDAFKWVMQDYADTLNRLLDVNKELHLTDLGHSKDNWYVQDLENNCWSWEIRKLPIQIGSTWTNPDYPVKYHKEGK